VISLQRYAGGRAVMLGSLAVGALGTALTAVGFFVAPGDAYGAYLVSFLYWVGICVGALLWLGAFHASNATWMVVLRRPLETMAAAAPVFVPLLLPLWFGMDHLFGQWTRPDPSHTELFHHLEQKRPYLNVPFFWIRAAIYFAVWIGVAQLLYRWSTRQDETGEVELTARQRRWGTGTVPLVGLTITFAAFDWIMSLEPRWQSTIFGVYYFAGSFLAAICLLTFATARATGPDAHGSLATTGHFHNLGKLMLAFVAFWAYIAFCQYMLIWVANLPEEVEWYLHRTTGAWEPLAIALVLAQFILPFAALLSRDLKLRPALLSWVAVFLLAVHLLDVYWMVMPSLHPGGPRLHWTLLTSFAGIGGLFVAFALFRARGKYAVPIRDPDLSASLGYVQP